MPSRKSVSKLHHARRALASAAGAAMIIGLAPAAAQAQGANIEQHGIDYFLQYSNGTDARFDFGRRTDQAVFGDWDGNGTDTPMVRRGINNFVSNSYAGQEAELNFDFGREGDQLLAGDWNGDGVDTIGVRRGNAFYLRNSNTSGVADITLTFGRADDKVLVGDFDGDGKDSLAVYRNGQFLIIDTLAIDAPVRVVAWAPPDPAVTPTVTPLAGNFDGRPGDELAFQWGRHLYVRMSDGTSKAIEFGRTSGDTMFVGDWEGDGTDNVGVRRYSANPAPVQPPEPAPAPPTSSRDQKVEAAIAFALKQVREGDRYVWSGEGPDVWDCSGLTQAAYRQAGINLPHQSTLQKNWAEARGIKGKPLSQAKRGDLMWKPGHVAIYLGNNRMVEAANPKLGLRETKVYSGFTYYTVIR